MLFSDLRHKLHRLTMHQPPGKESWKKMAPDLNHIPKSDLPYRKAAVLILFYPFNNDVCFILIKRTSDNGPHSGQISLPGGMAEPHDNSLKDTAAREASEELGVKKEDIVITSKLTELLIPVSHTEVSPFVGYIGYTPEFKPNPNEVKYLFPVNLEQISDPTVIYSEQKLIRNKNIKIPYYQLNGEKVWGATAMILSEFIDFFQDFEQ